MDFKHFFTIYPLFDGIKNAKFSFKRNLRLVLSPAGFLRIHDALMKHFIDIIQMIDNYRIEENL